MGKFNGKIALVTGSSSGIGRAMALRLAGEGATVVCADVNEDGIHETVALAEALGAKASAHTLDVSDEAAVKAALEKIVSDHGRLDILMNNAGVAYKRWDLTQAVNLSGVYYGLLHAAPIMAAQGGGAIVNTASVAGLAGLVPALAEHTDPRSVERMAAYVSSKHGVVGLTKAVRSLIRLRQSSGQRRLPRLCPNTDDQHHARERRGLELYARPHPHGPSCPNRRRSPRREPSSPAMTPAS